MRKIVILFLCNFVLIGCGAQVAPVLDTFPTNTIEITKQPMTVVLTSTLSSTRPSRTPQPSQTPTPTLESIPTSNFKDVIFSKFTPAPPASCPQISQTNVEIPTTFPEDESSYQDSILRILNIGGINQLLTYLHKTQPEDMALGM